MTHQSITLDYDELAYQIDHVEELLKSRKFRMAGEMCQVFLRAIEHDLSDDFGRDLATATLYDDAHEARRESYLALLRAYQTALRNVVLELLMSMKHPKDIESAYAAYQTLRRAIEKEISTAAYLLGEQAIASVFLTAADVQVFDACLRDHCRIVLQNEFFQTFSFVVHTVGRLDRTDFHLITEPYRDLRAVCDASVQLLQIMQDERFFGKEDVFIEHYLRDVNLYRQILWYLAIKSDLNKIAKFLDPNTYSKGMDQFCQVFASLVLLEEIIPHLETARTVGLSDPAAAEILEDYVEYWHAVLQHEEKGLEQTELRQSKDSKRLQFLKTLLDRHTMRQTKTKYRIDFPLIMLRGTPFAFRLGEYELITEQNPDGRKLRPETTIAEAIETLQSPVFRELIAELKRQYRSQDAVKLQALRWAWFAQRKLPPGYFEPPKYDYLKYVATRWGEKRQAHERALQKILTKPDPPSGQ